MTPLLGGAWGTTQAFVPGLEASVAWKKLDFYVEAEYVRDKQRADRQLLLRLERVGIPAGRVASRWACGPAHRAYGGERDIQRGPFAQVTWGPVTIGGFWFNPGSSDQVFVGSIGATF